MNDIRVRAATTDDAALYLRLFPELGLDERPPPLGRVLQLLVHAQIAEVDRAPVGYVFAEAEGRLGYLRQIVVDPVARRLGLGRALCLAAFERLRAAGAASVRLNVKEGNLGAIALYEQLGLRPDGPSAALWCTHDVRHAVAGSTTPLALVTPSPANDPGLEAAFGMPIGQVAFYRARGALSLVRVAGDRRHIGLVGFMRFAASMPGAFPFMARSLPAARMLLSEIERAVPEAPRFGLVIERDPALVSALLAAGATLRFAMLQMVGPL